MKEKYVGSGAELAAGELRHLARRKTVVMVNFTSRLIIYAPNIWLPRRKFFSAMVICLELGVTQERSSKREGF